MPRVNHLQMKTALHVGRSVVFSGGSVEWFPAKDGNLALTLNSSPPTVAPVQINATGLPVGSVFRLRVEQLTAGNSIRWVSGVQGTQVSDINFTCPSMPAVGSGDITEFVLRYDGAFVTVLERTVRPIFTSSYVRVFQYDVWTALATNWNTVGNPSVNFSSLHHMSSKQQPGHTGPLYEGAWLGCNNSSGTVEYTYNGGRTWDSSISLAGAAPLKGMAASTNRAIVIADSSDQPQISHADNLGSWSNTAGTLPRSDPSCITWCPTTDCWVVGFEFSSIVATSTNNGATWTSKACWDTPRNTTRIASSQSGTILAVSDTGHVTRSVDGGLNFGQAVSGAIFASPFTLAHIPNWNRWVVTDLSSGSYRAWVNDSNGGLGWQQTHNFGGTVGLGFTSFGLEDVIFVQDAMSGSLLYSADGGFTWFRERPTSALTTFGVSHARKKLMVVSTTESATCASVVHR